MSILMALSILSGESADLKHLFQEAAKTIQESELKNHPYLCRETVEAIGKFRDKIEKGKK